MAEQVKVSGGIGYGGLLTIVFIVLKLCGVISWKWIWVLAPMWISIAVVFLVAILLFFVYLLLPENKKRNKFRI